MLQTTIDNFHQNLQQEVDHCIENHEILHVKWQQGEDFVVISATDWRAIEETLFLSRQAIKDAKKLAQVGYQSPAENLLKLLEINPYTTPPRYEK